MATLDNAEKIARVCHEINRIWCKYNGDDSQPSWEEAPDWQKQSTVNGVIFHYNNPEAGVDASHNNWMKEKQDNGWVYGEIKNPEASPPTHPCLVPFEELPIEQQIKDAFFRTIVHATFE